MNFLSCFKLCWFSIAYSQHLNPHWNKKNAICVIQMICRLVDMFLFTHFEGAADEHPFHEIVVVILPGKNQQILAVHQFHFVTQRSISA